MKHISEIIPEAIGHIRPLRVLNLYAGIGGNRKLWENVEVTAVEYNEEIAGIYKEHFPGDEVIVADAHEYLLKNSKDFDFVWASPPCQTHSRMQKATRHPTKRYFDMKLWQEIIFLQHFSQGKWVVENVIPYYEPLIQPTIELSRHLFWTNFKILKSYTPLKNVKSFIQSENIEDFKNYLGIDIGDKKVKINGRDRTAQVMRNCVHPDLGLYIFEQAQGIMRQSKTNQLQIF